MAIDIVGNQAEWIRASVPAVGDSLRPSDLRLLMALRAIDIKVGDHVQYWSIGSGITTSEQGTHVPKGVPDEWWLFAVED